MTNWCENLVTISNDDRDVIKAIENAFLRDELLHAFIPCPKELRIFDEPEAERWAC